MGEVESTKERRGQPRGRRGVWAALLFCTCTGIAPRAWVAPLEQPSCISLVLHLPRLVDLAAAAAAPLQHCFTPCLCLLPHKAASEPA